MNKSPFSRINTAVILAAGMGVRLRNVIGVCPKGLLEIEGKSLIIRSLERLKSEGIDRVVIVTGFRIQCTINTLNLWQTCQRLNLFTARVLLKPEVCTRFL